MGKIPAGLAAYLAKKKGKKGTKSVVAQVPVSTPFNKYANPAFKANISKRIMKATKGG